MDSFLDTQEFKDDLKSACSRAMAIYGHAQSEYREINDLQQQVTYQFFKWLPFYRGSEKCGPVLFGIATNLLISAGRKDKHRRAYREVDWDSIDLESFRGPLNKDLDPEILVLLMECLSRLTDEERKAFVECRMNGQSLRAAATKLGVSATTVQDWLEKALAKLQLCFSSGR